MNQRLITFQWRLVDRNSPEELEGKHQLKCSKSTLHTNKQDSPHLGSDHRSPKRWENGVQSILVYDNDRPCGK